MSEKRTGKRHLEELPAPNSWKAKVRERLASPEWSQRKLAATLGIGQSTISQALSNNPTCRFVVEISEALGIEVPAEARVRIYAEQLASLNLEALERAAAYLEQSVDAAKRAEQADKLLDDDD